MDTTIPEIVESGPEIRRRQPESDPGGEPADRNVRPRLEPDQEVARLDEVENSEPTTQISWRCRPDTRRKSLWTIRLELHLLYLFRIRWCPPSNYLTVLPVETEFDSKAQAFVHGSVDAVAEQDSTTFEAIEGMAVFDNETQSFWVAPRPKDKKWCGV